MRTKAHSCHSVVVSIIVETACKALRTRPVRGVSALLLCGSGYSARRRVRPVSFLLIAMMFWRFKAFPNEKQTIVQLQMPSKQTNNNNRHWWFCTPIWKCWLQEMWVYTVPLTTNCKSQESSRADPINTTPCSSQTLIEKRTGLETPQAYAQIISKVCVPSRFQRTELWEESKYLSTGVGGWERRVFRD